MPRLMERIPLWIRHELGIGKALANARRDTDELERSLAAVDAVAARLAAQAMAQAAGKRRATTAATQAA